MPPKSKAAKAAATQKRPADPTTAAQAGQAKKAAKVEAASPKAGGARPKVDKYYTGPAGQVYQDADGNNWSVMLNQTNIGANNNKYYVIQLIEKSSGGYAAFTRWGRVGEPGASACAFGDLATCQKTFSGKFKDKTTNNWDNIRKDHTAFKKVDGKYMLIETAADDDAPVAAATAAAGSKAAVATGPVAPSKLEPHLQDVLKIIFDKDMFKNQMAAKKIDANRMPLGKLTKEQVEAGYHALEEVEDAIKKGASSSKLAEVTGKFYTMIPHDFGRSVPPVLNTVEAVAEKYDLLNMLNDIQIAMSMDTKANASKIQEHPLDRQYHELGNTMEWIDPKSDEYKVIDNYTKGTQGYRKCKILEAFRVDRAEDKTRMAKFKDVKNRKLLWHGTNIAVIAAIQKSGLRIMPSAGGRVGKGLYFASENGKSSGYVRTETIDKKQIGFMYLVEVVLGDQEIITRDDSSLNFQKVEKGLGKDSVLAKGTTEPDPKNDVQIKGDWQPITVPQGPVINTGTKSSFSQSEYLVYQEGRARMKYLLKMEFAGYGGW